MATLKRAEARAPGFMRFVNLILKRETLASVLALMFASGVCVALVFARIIWMHQLRYGFLVWNLFLAWLPLILSLFIRDLQENGQRGRWRFLGLFIAWLLFFPNAPYIFTDLIHAVRHFSHFWIDMTLILMCALTGLVLGFLSLYVMQSVVTRNFGRVWSWIFILAVTGLSSFGIYLGRFLRFNSWDVLFRPMKLFHGIGDWFANPRVSSVAFTVLFAAFLFIAYVMLYALTHLSQTQKTEA